MQPCRDGSADKRLHALRQQAQHDAGQHGVGVSSVGGTLALMVARPSDAAITVSLPLSTTTAPLALAAARARVSLSLCASTTPAKRRVRFAFVRGKDASALDRTEEQLRVLL